MSTITSSIYFIIYVFLLIFFIASNWKLYKYVSTKNQINQKKLTKLHKLNYLGIVQCVSLFVLLILYILILTGLYKHPLGYYIIQYVIMFLMTYFCIFQSYIFVIPKTTKIDPTESKEISFSSYKTELTENSFSNYKIESREIYFSSCN
jgi:hypothetical protein